MYPSFEESIKIIKSEFDRLVLMYPGLKQWTLNFNKNSMKVIAHCRWKKSKKGQVINCREINFSKKFLGYMSYEQIIDTVRHEVAHAIDFERRGTSDHGPIWKAVAVEVGANPKSMAHEGFVSPRSRLEPKFVCRTENGRIVKKFFRRPQLRSIFSANVLKHLRSKDGQPLKMYEVIDGKEYFIY